MKQQLMLLFEYTVFIMGKEYNKLVLTYTKLKSYVFNELKLNEKAC